jgi:hypothetical protein
MVMHLTKEHQKSTSSLVTVSQQKRKDEEMAQEDFRRGITKFLIAPHLSCDSVVNEREYLRERVWFGGGVHLRVCLLVGCGSLTVIEKS